MKPSRWYVEPEDEGQPRLYPPLGTIVEAECWVPGGKEMHTLKVARSPDHGGFEFVTLDDDSYHFEHKWRAKTSMLRVLCHEQTHGFDETDMVSYLFSRLDQMERKPRYAYGPSALVIAEDFYYLQDLMAQTINAGHYYKGAKPFDGYCSFIDGHRRSGFNCMVTFMTRDQAQKRDVFKDRPIILKYSIVVKHGAFTEKEHEIIDKKQGPGE